MQVQGWTLLFHDCIVGQLQRLQAAAARAERHDPDGAANHANVKLFRALSRLLLEVIPQDPGRAEYRQGNTLGPHHRHWRRAKVGRRFRVFFRYDTRARTIVYAWVNDADTLRATGGSRDPYAVFHRMLTRGNPPPTSDALVAASTAEWSEASSFPAGR